MTLVELYDSIVGQEPELELNSTSSPALLEKLRKGVLDWSFHPQPMIFSIRCPGLDQEKESGIAGERVGRGDGEKDAAERVH